MPRVLCRATKFRTASWLLVPLALLCMPEAAAAIPTSPSPSQVLPTLAFNSSSNNYTTGDPDVALGRTFAIVKANDQIQYISRNADGSLGTPNQPINDGVFWGTLAKDATPGNIGKTVTVTSLRGDGRVYYDPYGANDMTCEIGGRFFISELAQLNVNGILIGGTVLAISTGDDPTQAWDIYAIYDPSAQCPQNGLPCPGDQPRLGFNTNWITVWTDDETVGRTAAQLFVTSKHDAECNGIAQSQIISGMTNLVVPAITYQTNGADLDGSTLYFVNVESQTSGSVNVYEMTGTPTNASFNTTPIYVPHTLVNGGWDGVLPQIQQGSGTTNNISPGNGDDRFTAVVVRNHAIWAAQTIGLPASSAKNTAVQWWQIAIDGGGAGNGTVTDQERAGGHSPAYNGLDGNANDAGLAVNAAGDQLVSYSEIPYDSSTGGYGYLGAGYTFESHSDCEEAFGPQKYEPGLGLYPITPFLPPRTGDYTAAAVDPIDDNGFITGAAYAGVPSGGYDYWAEAIATIQPAQPPKPHFIDYDSEETECTSTQTNCSVTVSTSSKAANGDTLFAVVVAGLEPASMTLPGSAWTKIPLANQSGSLRINAADNGCLSETGWVAAKTITNGGGSFSFTVPVVNENCSGTQYTTEIGALLLDYRNACTKMTNPFNGASNFKTFGYAVNADSQTISTVKITVPDNTTLLDVFQGAAECLEQGEPPICPNFSSISGSPTLFTETPTTISTNSLAFLAADLYTDTTNGAKYGGYSTSDNWAGPDLAWHVQIPPY